MYCSLLAPDLPLQHDAARRSDLVDIPTNDQAASG